MEAAVTRRGCRALARVAAGLGVTLVAGCVAASGDPRGTAPGGLGDRTTGELDGKADGALPRHEAGGPDCPAAGPSTPLAFRRAWNRARAALRDAASARHALTEPVVRPGGGFTLRGHFSYGLADHALEGEEVRAYVRRTACGPWEPLGAALTDEEGIAWLVLPPGTLTAPGVYELEWVVVGDLTRARGSVWVVEAGAMAAVFDIDGTLAVHDAEAVLETLFERDTEAWPDAEAVVGRYAASGHLPVYLTGRPPLLYDATHRWLAAHGFPPGPVLTPTRVLEGLGGAVERYKRLALATLEVEAGLALAHAYGNKPTDVCAYAAAGIPPAQTYVIGPHAGEACPGFEAPRALESYSAHLPELDDTLPSR